MLAVEGLTPIADSAAGGCMPPDRGRRVPPSASMLPKSGADEAGLGTINVAAITGWLVVPLPPSVNLPPDSVPALVAQRIAHELGIGVPDPGWGIDRQLE